MWDAVTNRSGVGAATRKVTIIIIASALLMACSSAGHDARLSLAPPPPFVISSDPMADRAPTTLNLRTGSDLVIAENQALALTVDPPVPSDCSLKDRFDSSSALSVASSDGTRKLALDVDAKGSGFGGAMVRYTVKFGRERAAKDKTHCLYPGRVQGLLPSTYRELVKRKNDTVWHRLRAMRADLVE